MRTRLKLPKTILIICLLVAVGVPSITSLKILRQQHQTSFSPWFCVFTWGFVIVFSDTLKLSQTETENRFLVYCILTRRLVTGWNL